MKIVIVCTALFASVIAEPPVDNRYLPPQQGFNGGGGFGPPSQSYGAPNGGFGQQRQTDAVFRARPSSTYGAPNGGPSRRPSHQSAVPRAPSNQYGPPNAFQPSNQYVPPSQPSNQYGAPGFNTPSSQYGAPQLGATGRQGAGASRPDTQYGTPFVGNSFGGNQQGNSFGAQSRQYLPPGGNGNSGNGYSGNGYSGNDDGSNGEPANYNFEYMVKDDASGNDFGHRESRQGDRAEGLYYVLLPDGRKQTVEYEADQNGYRPKISYEDTGAGAGGYGNQNGYQNGNQFGGPY